MISGDSRAAFPPNFPCNGSYTRLIEGLRAELPKLAQSFLRVLGCQLVELPNRLRWYEITNPARRFTTNGFDWGQGGKSLRSIRPQTRTSPHAKIFFLLSGVFKADPVLQRLKTDQLDDAFARAFPSAFFDVYQLVIYVKRRSKHQHTQQDATVADFGPAEIIIPGQIYAPGAARPFGVPKVVKQVVALGIVGQELKPALEPLKSAQRSEYGEISHDRRP